MARLKMEPGIVTTTTSLPAGATVTSANMIPASGGGSIDCYEDVFKEITKKLYGEEGLPEALDANTVAANQSIVYDPDIFRTDGLTLVTTGNGLPPGTIVLQRRLQDDKGMTLGTVAEHLAITPAPPQPAPSEERWFESEDTLDWTTSKIARYNPSQKVFRCVDCDFVGFLSRVAEHWLGNHASLRVFQCPRCPYTSAWARCVRMHLTRQHGETLNDNSLWKENPVLEEVTKFLTSLKTRVEQKTEANNSGEKRYTCPFCTYATDRRDLFNRHENIHRDEKPFQCYVCDKQFNRADHVKKHFTRMHRDHPYDINRIRKNLPKTQSGISFYSSTKFSKQRQQQLQQQQQNHATNGTQGTGPLTMQMNTSAGQQAVNVQQIPHIAYFNPPTQPGHTGPLQGIHGVGGTKKEIKAKGPKKKKTGEKMYTCSYCPWQGVDNWCLKRHLNTHIKPFLCALCDYKAARSERLATHVLKVHNKRVCHKCSFLADDVEGLSQHIQDSHQNPLIKTGYNCNVCQEYFELRADLEAHAILEHHKVIVQCDLCDFRTTDELSMEAHLRDKHNLQPGMGAVAAAAAAAAAAALTSQSQVQVTQPNIQISEQIANQLHAQQQQQQQHQQDQAALSLADQIAAAMPEPFDTEALMKVVPKIEPEDDDKDTETVCSNCGCEFPDSRQLKRHLPQHELRFREIMDPRTSKSISRTYTCSICSYNCATIKTMMQHLRLHTGMEAQCRSGICSFQSAFDNAVKEHVHTDHFENQLRCPHCGVRVLSINDFTIHWRNHHSTICSLCVAVYKNKYGIKECDIHDLVAKKPYELIDDVEKLFLPNSEQETQAVDENGEVVQTQAELDAKQSRLEYEASIRLMGNYFNREGIKFLPKLNEIVVNTLRIPESKEEKRKWLRKYPQDQKSMKRRRHVILEPKLQVLVHRSPLFSPGYKCWLRDPCRNKSWKYSSKRNLILHKLWNHSKPLIKCDNCEKYFCYEYQVYVHTIKSHPTIFSEQQLLCNKSDKPQAQSSGGVDNNNVIYKHE